MAASVAVPASVFADQSNTAWKGKIDYSLSNLNDVMKAYAGAVDRATDSARDAREKGLRTLQTIRQDVVQAGNSGGAPKDIVQNAIKALDDADLAMSSQNPQTISRALQTAGEQVRALQASFSGTPRQDSPRQSADESAGRPAKTDPENTSPPPADGGKLADAKERLSPPQQPAEMPEPTRSATAALAGKTRDDIIGQYLADKAGNNVGRIQEVKMSADGRIEAVEVDVGGFLGIGSKRIVVPVSELSVLRGHLQSLSKTADELAAMRNDQN